MKVKKRIVKITLISLLTIVGLAGIAVTVLLTQQQRLINIALTEINRQLNGELTLEKSNVSLFKNFPYISIALHEARLYENKTKSGKPLFEIGRLYVGFSLTDLLNERYHIKRLFIKGGHLDLELAKNGTLNLMDALNLPNDTTATESSGDGTAAILLNKMVIKNVALSYLDSAGGTQLNNVINDLEATFKTNSSHLLIAIKSDMDVDFKTRIDTVLFRDKQLALDIHADYDKLKKFLDLSSGGVWLNEGSFSLQGTADLGEQKHVDFKVKGDRPDIGLLTAFIPADVKETLSPFQYDARIYFDGTIKGSIANKQLPLIEISFGCEDAWFLNKSAAKKVDQLGFNGFYTNGAEHSLRTSEVHISQVRARPEKGIFEGNFIIKDFFDPHINVKVNADLELEFLGEFLGIKDLEQLKGRIKLRMNFNEMADLDDPEQLLVKLKEGIESELIVENLSMRVPGYPYQIDNLDLHAEMSKGKITIDSLSARIGNSDLKLNGSLSDLPSFLHDHSKPVVVTLNASSKRLVLKELMAYDTARSKNMTEEIHGFNIATVLETSVNELLHPAPLPKGRVEVKDLRASFADYPHAFHHIGAQLIINDTALMLRNFKGEIDDSDFQFSGRVANYQLWMADFKKGKTQIAFDFKSNHLAMQDILGMVGKEYVPRGYRREELNNIWLRAKADMVYDTAFRFASVLLRNASGELKKHHFNVKNVRGKFLYGTNRILKVDTLRGSIGNTDFDVNMRLFAGKDRKVRKRTNYFHFKSNRLDIDEINNYDFSKLTARTSAPQAVVNDSVQHADAFNIFKVPFSDFDVEVDIGTVKYNSLWLKKVTGRLRMQEDHYIYLDTLSMEIARGTVFMKGYFNGSNPEKIFFNSKLIVNGVDLEKLMIKFDRFGQDMVINKNIKGRITGTVKSHIRIHPDFVPIIDDSKAELDIVIHQGSLVNFAPMQAVASYFKDKNLNVVRFDTLKNVLTFASGVLNIPAMNINSSIGFMEVSGKQSLDQSMEYNLRIPLKLVTQVGFQALFGKKQSEVDMDQVDAIQYRDKDKNVRFLNILVRGTPDKYDIVLGKAKR